VEIGVWVRRGEYDACLEEQAAAAAATELL